MLKLAFSGTGGDRGFPRCWPRPKNPVLHRVGVCGWTEGQVSPPHSPVEASKKLLCALCDAVSYLRHHLLSAWKRYHIHLNSALDFPHFCLLLQKPEALGAGVLLFPR